MDCSKLTDIFPSSHFIYTLSWLVQYRSPTYWCVSSRPFVGLWDQRSGHFSHRVYQCSWSPKTSTLRFPWGKMTINLDGDSSNLGLPSSEVDPRRLIHNQLLDNQKQTKIFRVTHKLIGKCTCLSLRKEGNNWFSSRNSPNNFLPLSIHPCSLKKGKHMKASYGYFYS